MAGTPEKPRRVVNVRRGLTLGTLAVAVSGSAIGAAPLLPNSLDTPDRPLLAAGEGGEGGEGEGGEGGSLAPEAQLIRDLGLVEGRLRAGLALYEAGDMDAARAHLSAAMSAPHKPSDSRLATDLAALAEAAKTGQGIETLRPLHDAALATIARARSAVAPGQQLAGIVALTHLAGDEYSAAVTGGALTDLHAYQTAFGLLEVATDQATAFATSDDAALARAGQKMVSALQATGALFGDVQGQGTFDPRPGVIFGAAARIELAAAGVK